ncbi:DUF3301 domain-containing protein [Pseudomonas sp. HK3]|jgi:hypothetical protein
MLLTDVFIVLVLMLFAWLWWLDRGLKQTAYKRCKQYCDEANVQLLDDNIQIHRTRLKKNSRNQWRLYRCFTFEFTSTQEQRYQGRLEMMGRAITNIELDPYRI